MRARSRVGVGVALAVMVGGLALAGCGRAGQTSGGGVATGPGYAPGRHVVSFDVGGRTRTAVLLVPADLSRPAPTVFVFHGHGGSGAAIARTVPIETLWPEAVVVYPDGVVGHKGVTDPEGTKPGWQTVAGESGDEDLAFYDTMLAALRAALPLDPDRLYVMGHSNGSAFASLLLNQRGDAIAATAHISAPPSERLLATDPVRSMFISLGQTDPIVSYDQARLSIPRAERMVGADPARATASGYLRSEPGPGNLELATYVHPGGHAVPAPVPALVVEFFKRHTLSGG